MAAPKHVTKKLREMLGNEAGESMVEWLDARDTHVDELRQDMRGELADVRQEMRTEFAELRQEISALREEMRAGFAAMDAKMAHGFAAIEIEFSQRNAELMKWALGFWIASLLGVVAALAALTRVPR
jgi:hypothetical protein